MKLNTSIFISKAINIHGDVYDYSQVEYVNMKTKVKIICSEHGVFEQTPDKHLHGRCGCPICAGNQKSNSSDFIKKSLAVHGDVYDYSLVEYINNRTSVNIICSVHGVFQQLPFNHLTGKGCPKCANNVLLSNDEFVDKANRIHNYFYDYSDVEYNGNRSEVSIKCPLHGLFQQVAYVHLNGSGCPLCGHEQSVLHRNSVLAHEKAMQTCLERYGVDNPMKNEQIYNKHKDIVSSDVVNEKRINTKRCNGSFNTSLSEYRLYESLVSVFGEDDILTNYCSDVYPFRCDFYIKSRDLYIELNAHWSHGGHWYNEFEDKVVVDEWISKSKFYKNSAQTFMERDVRKKEFARLHKLNYVVFWKSDLSDAKQWFDLGCPDGCDWDVEYSWLR